MLVPPKLAGVLTTLVAGAALFLMGCSSSSPRDMNYGTDVGADFIPPDAAGTTTDNAVQSTTTDAATPLDSTSFDSTDATDIDRGVVVDASIDFADFVDSSDDSSNDINSQVVVDASTYADN